MLRRSPSAIVVALLLAALAGCSGAMAPGVAGSGEEQSEQRDVAGFDRIRVVGLTDVTVTIGEPSVTVRGDDNLIGEVVTEVDGGTLTVDERRQVRPRAGLTVEVTTPRLVGAELQGSGDLVARDVAGEALTWTLDGSGDLTVDGVDADVFRGDVNGSGDLDAAGRAERLELVVNGSGEADLRELTTRQASVEASGSGDALVRVSESLEASSSGSGDVIYAGAPPDVQEDASGSGDIRPE